jgi:pseudouridine synthase
MAEERLQKVLAAAGVASRRAAEEMIVAGRVQVNGQTVTELGVKVDPAVALIAVDGRPVVMPQRHIYFKVHKPRGVLSDWDPADAPGPSGRPKGGGENPDGDTHGRQTVADLLPPDIRRVFPVGRLDLNSEGLMLLTDDGELAHQLTHPRFEHPKTYYVLVAERPAESALQKLRDGVDLEEGMTAPAQVRVVPRLPKGLALAPGPTSGIWLEVVLHEGKKRQIRHMTAAVGHPTLRLIRWAIGPLLLGDLAAGAAVPLTRREVGSLRSWVYQPINARRAQMHEPGASGSTPPLRNARAPGEKAQAPARRPSQPAPRPPSRPAVKPIARRGPRHKG